MDKGSYNIISKSAPKLVKGLTRYLWGDHLIDKCLNTGKTSLHVPGHERRSPLTPKKLKILRRKFAETSAKFLYTILFVEADI